MQDKRQPSYEMMNIEVTPDKLIAVISFSRPQGGERLSLEEIQKQIHERGITYGLDQDVLLDLAKNREEGFKYIVARGRRAQKGEDATEEFYFDKENLDKIKPHENEDGTVDFKDLNIVHNVTPGQVLYKKVPATEGIEGRTIFGEVIRAQKGKDLRLPRGKNVGLLEDGVTLVADISGKLCYDNYNIYIAPLLSIENDVDSSTGNIEFVGSVIIHGSVKNGFSVKASGNVEIHGSVEAAHIEATGDVVVWYGIQGMDRGTIKVGGNLVAKFIQNAQVEATGNVVVEAIMHSQVAANNIYVDKGKGSLVGGKVVAAHYIMACIIGSPMATQTDIQIGTPAHIMNEFKTIEKTHFTLKEELHKISQSISFLTTKQTQSELASDKAELLRKLLITRQQKQIRQKEITQKYQQLYGMIQDAVEGQIKVKNILHPGTKVTMGNLVKYIQEDATHCSVKRSSTDIVIGMY